MALYWMEDGKRATDLPKSRKQYYLSSGRKLNEIGVSEDELLDYVADVINAQCEIDIDGKVFFRPGFTFNKNSVHWDVPQPLSRLWQARPNGVGYSKQDAGTYLGLLVYQYMLDNTETWYCTKTAYSNRDFETMVYWKSNE